MRAFRQTSQLPQEASGLRRALFIATGTGLTVVGVSLFLAIIQPNGITPVEWILLALFVPLFGQISFGFTIALWGFLILLRGETFEVMRTIPDAAAVPGSTAVVLPVYNEDPTRTFAGLENMFRSLQATGHGTSFDFFVLSDSNIPDRWIEEEVAWFRLCKKLDAFGRIFYRKRRVSLHGKSGNIADFCRRWGTRYRYIIILDADSVMEGSTLVRMAQAMDANPTVGIIQTQPQIVRGASLFQRLLQFTTRSAGPVFAAGSNFWHLDGGNYWGHNAILRLQPFMDYCVLPEIPGNTAADRHLMSHDTIEATLMRKAGYQVWFAYLEPGSYEESPPNLLESLKRDRRWCQGNLQHYWFLFAPSTPFPNRVHIFFGLMAYLSAPMLSLFIGLSAFDYHAKEKFAVFAALPETLGHAATLELLAVTVVLLFAPKLFGMLRLLARPRPFGGVVGVVASSALDVVFSVLMAPVLLFFYTKFVLLALLGMRVAWKTQVRSDSTIPLGDAVRQFGGATLTGLAATVAAATWVPGLLPWLSPVLTGLVLAIPLAMLTSSSAAGRSLEKLGLLLIPEETAPPPILDNLDGSGNTGPGGLTDLMLDPLTNSIHLAILRRSKVRTRHKETRLQEILGRFLADGPEGLSRREVMALLWDADSVAAAHRALWASPSSQLHEHWQKALDGRH